MCNGDAGAGLAATTIVGGYTTTAMSFNGASQPFAGGEDAFIAAVGPDGKVAWGKVFGSPNADRIAGVAVDPQGGIFVTGYVQGQATLPGCPSFGASATSQTPNAFVAMLDSTGTCKWLKPFTGNSAGTGIALVPGSGTLVVIGRFYGMIGYGNASRPTGPLHNNNNTFVAEVNASDGSLVGSLASIDVDQAGDPVVAASKNGDVFVAGSVSGDISGQCPGWTKQMAYLVPFNANLGMGMVRCYYGTADVGHFGLAVDGAGSVVLALTSAGKILGSGFNGATVGPAVFNVLKLDASWNQFRWAVSGGQGGLAIQGGIAVDGMGDVLVSGVDIMPFDPGGAFVLPGSFVFALAP
jgi:hypothetical protein